MGALKAIRAPLARVVEVYALRRTATNLLNTYVGHSAGARILSGHIRRGYPSYRATCTPAAFPTPALPIGPPPGCALPPSRELTCSRTGESPAFLPAVEGAIDALRAQRPEIFSGDRVLDADAYHEGVARLLTAGGRCARFDGQEIVVKDGYLPISATVVTEENAKLR